MTDRSIDFQPLPQEAHALVRKSFRVPVSHKNKILAVLQDQPFSVTNISGTGIAVLAETCLAFEQGQILKDVELLVGDTRLAGLTGRVVHCSVHASGELHFGIEWQNLTDKDLGRMLKTVEAIKVRALQQDGLSDNDA